MVQITHARIKDGEGWKTISARYHEEHKADYAETDCHCPDPSCPAKLVHHKQHKHTYYDPETHQPFTLKIAAYYQRRPNSPLHSPGCTAVRDYQAYQGYARHVGGLSIGHGAYVFNLNILTDNEPAPLRHGTQRRALPFPSHDSRHHSNLDQPERRKLSEGLSRTSELAQLIDRTEFHPMHRHNILLRHHGRTYRLPEIFYDDPVKLFSAELKNAREGRGPHPVALEFKPIKIGKFHSPRNWTLQGQAMPIASDDGKQYYVSMMLHCASEKMYEEMREMIKGKRGINSFMVFSDHVYVDRLETEQKIRDIKSGKAKDTAVYVHVHVSRPDQVYAWGRNKKQMRMDMDLATMLRPPKDVPPQLLQG